MRGRLSHYWGPVVIGDTTVSIEIDFLPDPSDAGRTCPAILLHSEAYEAAVDLVRRRTLPRGKRALIEFCVAAAAAISAEGFSLSFARDAPVEALTIESLVTGLTTGEDSGLVGGIAAASPSSAQVKTYWPSAAEQNGYLIVEFL